MSIVQVMWCMLVCKLSSQFLKNTATCCWITTALSYSSRILDITTVIQDNQLHCFIIVKCIVKEYVLSYWMGKAHVCIKGEIQRLSPILKLGLSSSQWLPESVPHCKPTCHNNMLTLILTIQHNDSTLYTPISPSCLYWTRMATMPMWATGDPSFSTATRMVCWEIPTIDLRLIWKSSAVISCDLVLVNHLHYPVLW